MRSRSRSNRSRGSPGTEYGAGSAYLNQRDGSMFTETLRDFGSFGEPKSEYNQTDKTGVMNVGHFLRKNSPNSLKTQFGRSFSRVKILKKPPNEITLCKTSKPFYNQP